jgi:nucleoside-diphosphate-sugar epimerase
VLLTGASSQIGVFAIPRLLQAGFHIFAVSRKGRPAWCPDHEQVEWVSGEDAERISGRCQYLLSAGPMALAAQLLQTGRQLKSAVVFSSSSVETKQQSGSAEERSQVQAMRALESAIRGEAVTRETKLVILRPTLIYGCGLDSNISRLAIWISRFGFIPVNGMAGGLRQPVHADDLASVAIAAMLSENSLPAVLTLSGGSTLSYKEMVSAIFVALGRPVRMFHLPERVLLGILRMAKIFGAGSGINGEMIKRQRTDLVFNNQQAQELLNYQPRPFAPAEEDFLMPDLDNFKT